MSGYRSISFDAVIVGGGGAGMRAAQPAQSGYKTAVISKVFPAIAHCICARWYHLRDRQRDRRRLALAHV